MVDIPSLCSGLSLGEDGIWYHAESQNISYPADGNEACFTLEDSSFWFRHRNNCIVSIVEKYPPEANGTIFDIGGGNGFVAWGLAQAHFDVALVEPGRVGAANAKGRGLKTVICATMHSARFKPESLPAIGLFDVLEHIEDDLSFLRQCNKILQKRGRLYLTVPAYPTLWSEEDVLAGHFRRYTRKSICQVVEAAGFQIEYFTYIFCLLPLPIALLRTLPSRLGLRRTGDKTQKATRDHAVKNSVLGRILDLLLGAEVKNVRKGKAMRCGGSCLVVASL